MIEADSLASLNLLAANPPRYPVNPTDTPRDPLTLYISRVPGTRDVILSTLKPHRKNVTFEDVANALYYIHLDVPSDTLHHGQAASQVGASPASIARKPVPSPLAPVVVPPLVPSEGVPAPAPSATEAPPVLPPISPLRTSTEVTRRPVPASQPQPLPQPLQTLSTSTQSQPLPQPLPLPLPLPQLITRKPLGPRPLNPLSDYERSLLPPLPPRPTQSLSASSLPPSPTRSPLSPRSPTHPTQISSPFQLTVIRRDPSTQHQWNIGKVIGDGQDEVDPTSVANTSTNTTSTTTANTNAIKIVLETSGYAKFRDASDDTFHRDVAMEYGKSWTAGLRKVKDVLRDVTRPRGGSVTSDALFADRNNGSDRNNGNDRSEDAKRNRHSFDGRLEKDRADRDKDKDKDRQEDLKPKGYAFASPWDGRCEFRTGNGGRSLKLRHVLGEAAHSAGGYNPLTIVQGLKDGQGLGSIPGIAPGRARAGSLSSALAGAVPVSELRFNLPGGDVFGHRGHRSSRSTSSENSYEDDEEEEAAGEFAGLELGRERAGGGNRGKRAKLGKLIVYDDGFKMLDLVVAANMGVWWVSWEKVF